MSKLSLAAILIVVIVGAVWIEQGHRVVVEPLAAAVKACPDTDAVPYSAGCLEFIATEPTSGVAPARQ